MSPFADTEALLQKRLGELRTQCLRGSENALMTLVFSGTLCAKLLAEQLIQEESKGNAAIEGAAAATAKGWPISFPALDDGRTNRVVEQLPNGLKQSLKINRSDLKATGRHTGEHQELDTFLEHSLKHEGVVLSTDKKGSALGSIMGALIVLHRECAKGNIEVASVVADFGVRISELLEELMSLPEESKTAKALLITARKVSEWPIHLRHRENLKELQLRVPDCLGMDLGFRINKRPGTRADRDLSSSARSGFAFGYFKDLETARKLAQKYDSPDKAHYSRLIEQAKAASEVLFDRDYQKKRNHVVPKINAALPTDLLSLAQTPMEDVPPEYQVIAAITRKLLDVVPFGTHPMWTELRELPDLSGETLQRWIETAMSLAEIRCKGNWAGGEWPPKISKAVKKRLIATGAKDENYLFKEVIGLWMQQGFHNLCDNPEG